MASEKQQFVAFRGITIISGVESAHAENNELGIKRCCYANWLPAVGMDGCAK